ncbi:hypothetical protein M8J76_006101 [Diaphorina citri]|nr:hypothetical protein M8J76_006101 [Diaphorina citri]
MSQLVSCQTLVHNNQLNLHQHHLHSHHHTGSIAHRNPLPSEFPIIRTSRDTKQDESSSMSMLQWMRQMIFKTKSMYMKHRLEFELSGCMMGFVRKIISLIYNSLYSFNKKLMFAKNIKMEDIRGVGKASNSLPMTQNENSSTTQHENSTSEKINEIIANKTLTLLVKENSINVNNNETIPDKMRNNTEKVLKPNNNVDKRHVIKEKQSNTRKKETRKVVKKPAREKQTINKKGAGNKGGVTIITSKLIQNNTNNSKKSKETSVGVNNTTELQKMYSKLYDINGELQRNINTMNELYRNISLNIDSLKDVMKNISNEKMDLRLKPLNISESLKTNVFNTNDKLSNNMNIRRSTLHTLEETQTDKTNIWRNDKGEFNANKTKNAGIEVSIEKSLEEDKVHNHLISSNEIPDTIVGDVGRSNYKDMKIFPSNRYNFTQNQVKVISHRVNRLLNHLSGNTNTTLEFSSRQFSQDSILDSINSLILYFLGFVPEEDSMAYFMSMVGKETTQNLLRIGNGFNAMRTSQLFTCMSHYGSTKFWNWIDSCC